ncbi:MAG: ShlB/FhaC/HecB family hemolysin secretion/activation protein [Pseudomonadota bacterium]
MAQKQKQGLRIRVLIAALIGVAPTALAQTTPNNIPFAAEPRPWDAPPLEIPALEDFSLSLPLPDRSDLQPAMLGEQVFLERIAVNGATVFTNQQLTDLFELPLPGDVLVSDIFDFEAAISEKYRAQGYSLSFALVPPQDLSNGVLSIEIIEGFIDAIEIRGDSRNLNRTIRGILRRDVLERPLQAETVERAMLLASDLPGVSVQGILRPAASGVRGGADFIVDVSLDHASVNASYDNRGTEFQGYEQYRTTLRANAPGGLPLELNASIDARRPESEGFNYTAGAAYWFPNGRTLASIQFGEGSARIGGRIRELPPEGLGLDFNTRTAFQNITLEHFLERTRRLSVSVGARLSRFKSVAKESGAQIFRDRLTEIGVRALVETRDLPLIGGDLSIDFNIDHGLPAFGASREGVEGFVSRIDGEIDHTIFSVELLGSWSILSAGVFIDLRAEGQRSTTHLLSSKEFSLGGARYGRGYQSGEIGGEHGVAASIEISRPIRFGPTWAPTVIPYAFYEIGRVWDTDVTASGGDQSIASAGMGVRLSGEVFRGGPSYSLFGETARPLTRPPSHVFDDGAMKSRNTVGAEINFAVGDSLRLPR